VAPSHSANSRTRMTYHTKWHACGITRGFTLHSSLAQTPCGLTQPTDAN
jgi:hypothetical protein